MRYIAKSAAELQCMSTYKANQLAAGLAVFYDDFPDKSTLNEVLRIDQKNICCYCMQVIDHHEGDNEAGSHNEHLQPQNGPYAKPALQMDYTNLYACCNYTKGYPPDETYCGEHKKSDLITNFIAQANCRTFFRYNINGEILPNGNYFTEQEYHTNQLALPKHQQDALATIKTLNLNHPTLKKKRADLISSYIPLISHLTPQQAKGKIQKLVNAKPLPLFVEVSVYYLNQVQ